MISVRVRVDHRDDGPSSFWLAVDQIERRCRGLGRGQRVEDDPAGVGPDEGDVGGSEATHLIDVPRHDFIQAVFHVEQRLPLQRW